jgi:hypothetical protein
MHVGSSPAMSGAISSIVPNMPQGVPSERGLAPAPEARLVGDDLYDDSALHPGMADVHLEGGDLHGESRSCLAPVEPGISAGRG